MSVGNTVMIFGLGSIGSWVMEFLARRQGVSRIIGCDKREDWGSRKVNDVAVGAAIESHCKTVTFERCDVFDTNRTVELIQKYDPDLIYSRMKLMSLMPLSRYLPPDVVVNEHNNKIAGALIPSQLAPVYALMQAVKESGSKAICLNNSWPDIVNAMLYRNGFKVLVGAGNLDIIVGEIRRKISIAEDVPICSVTVYLVAEHSVVAFGTRTGIPYFLKIMIGDKDVTSKYNADSLISDRLTSPCPSDWSSWIKQPPVASSAVKTIMAIVNDTNELSHAPGPNGLVGGYPIRVFAKGVKIELPEGLTMEEAIMINTDAIKYEGIEEVKDDGTLVVTGEAYEKVKKLLGIECREIRVSDALGWADEIIAAFRKFGDKHGVEVPVY